MFVAFTGPLYKYSSFTPLAQLFKRDKEDDLARAGDGKISEAPLQNSTAYRGI